MNSKRKFVSGLFPLLLIAVSISLLTGCSDKAEKAIDQVVANYSKSCPIDLGNGIRLDSITHPKAHTLAYFYTMIYADKSSILIDPDDWKNNLKANVKAAKDAENLRKLDVIFNYSYYDKNGEFCFTCVLTPEDYK